MTQKTILFFSWSSIRSRGRSIGDWLNLMGVLSISIVDLLANLLGESEINSLASRSSKLGDALLRGNSGVFNLWDSDALLLSEVFTADSWERDWLVDTGLNRLRIGDGDWWLNNSNNWDVVASLLGDLLAVVVAVGVVTISGVGLADSDHHVLALLLEGHLNGLGGGGLSLGLVGVGADLVVDLLGALGADGAGDGVALLNILDALAAQLNGGADSIKGRGAHISNLNNIQN